MKLIIFSLILTIIISFVSCDNIDGYLEYLKDYNISLTEAHKLLFCYILNIKKQQQDKDQIYELKEKFNTTSKDAINDKLDNEFIEMCYEKVDSNNYSEYIQNFTIIKDIVWKEEFEEFAPINYTKFRRVIDFSLTRTQQALSFNFHKVLDVFRQKRKDDREKLLIESRKLKIGSFEIQNIPGYIKAILFLVIFGLLFEGVSWLLGTLNKGKKTQKKKRKYR